MKRVLIGALAVILVLSLGTAGALAAGQGKGAGKGRGPHYVDVHGGGICVSCQVGNFTDADGDGVCDAAGERCRGAGCGGRGSGFAVRGCGFRGGRNR